MKIGPVEGTPEEISGFFSNNGLNIAEFINANQPIENPRRHNLILICSIIAFVIINCCMWVFDCHENLDKILVVFDFVALAFAVFFIHRKFDKYVLSGFAIFIGLIIMAVCTGYMTPAKAIDKLDNKNPLTEQKE